MTERSPSVRVLVAIAVALAALVAWTCWRRWQLLDDTPFPVGIDGYFYPVQLRALLERHELAYSDFPLAFWLMTPFAAATDPLVGAKLAAAFYGGLSIVPAYGVGARLGKSPGAGFVAAALVATSAGSSYLTIEFVKNGIGMTIALTAVWLVLRAADRPTRLRIALAIACALATFATHKLAGAFVVAVGAPAALAAASDRGVIRGRRLLYAIASFTAIALAAGLAVGHRLVAAAMGSAAHLDAPALVRGDHVLLSMGHEALIGAVLAWLALAALTFSFTPTLSRATRAVAWASIVLSLAFAFPWLAVDDPQGVGFRVRVIAFLPMAMCAAIVAGALHRAGTRIQLAALAAVAVVLLVAMPARRIEGRIVAHPAMIAAVQAMTGDVPAGDVVVTPERHIMFMIAWYTRLPVRLEPDEVPEAHRWRVMPLAFIGLNSPLDHVLMEARREPTIPTPIGLHPRHPNGLVLVREPTWRWLLDQLDPDARAHFAAWPTI